MNNCEWLLNMTYEQREEWLNAEHADANDGKRPESDVRADSVDANDSREKLEADVGFIVKEGFVTYKGIIGWLDRQAAITEEQTRYKWVTKSAYEIAELKRERDEWKTKCETREVAYKQADAERKRYSGQIDELQSRIDELEAELEALNKPISKSDARKTAETLETDAAKGDIRDFDDSREKINALRAYYGSGPTTMTDEQIEAGREVYGARKHVDMVIVDEIADSREKLEADLEELRKEWKGYEGNYMRVYSYVAYAQIIELLDRQAAITERECRKPNWDYCETCEALEGLREALDQQRAATANANDLWGRTRDELAAVKAELLNVKYERDNLADDLLSATRERETYRSLFGKSLDLADEIKALGADCDTGVAR